MPVIRVAFFLDHVAWHGGVNYFRSLFSAVQSVSDVKIQPVVITGLKTDTNNFDDLVEVIRTPILDRYTFLWWLSKFCTKIFPFRDYILYSFLRKCEIDLISHNSVLWKNRKIPSIGWIPDFQHLHLPDFFDKYECEARDKQFLDMIQRSNAMLLSSHDALNDLNEFCIDSTSPAHILRFVPSINEHISELPNISELSTKYNIEQPWFYIPNQFWAHKNHLVVIEALRLLKAQGNNFLVIATGCTEDSRNVNYFPTLMEKVENYGLHENFRVLGMVPFSDVVALMRHSIAVINPSLFEGWSTSVEESKTLGKVIILSDIAVHREQNPERGYFFEPQDKDMLADTMKIVYENHDNNDEDFYYNKAQSEYMENRVDFAKRFEDICNDVILKCKK